MTILPVKIEPTLMYVRPSKIGFRRVTAMLASLLVLASAVMLFFAFFYEPMAGRDPGALSGYGLLALFGGTVLQAVVNLRRRAARPA